ncbi:MAG TPA: DUF1998 domain-containing protein, partial [Chthonomonadales bacterium]|nr:DUF1998 domain-containing protein [Chthonomonadales bacterium]
LYLGRCPQCQGSRRRSQAIRFVMACRNGHMDDVNWSLLVHGGAGRRCQQADWFRWEGGGGSLRELRVGCPHCHARAALADVYDRRWPCSGRRPENEPRGGTAIRPWDCKQPARLIQRQATNLRIPEPQTFFTIPPMHTALHRLLENPPVIHILKALGGLDTPERFDQFRIMVENLNRDGTITDANMAGIFSHTQPEIMEAAAGVLAPPPGSMREALLQEFRALIEGSARGVPSSEGSGFEITRDRVRVIPAPDGRLVRVAPISRLRTLTVQLGYRRLVEPDPQECQLVSVAHQDSSGIRWLPGVEYLGEGIFIMLDGNDGWHFPLTGEDSETWRRVALDPSSYPTFPFRTDAREELHPVFIWWHTLAHILIRALALHSGYGATSVRERVYLEIDGDRVRGGVVLYTSQPGTDGSLGGLVALVPHFEAILAAALENLFYCSNGYLCDENRFRPGHHGGASCYGCTVISETSCEHRNMWLDRRVLLGNLP